MPIPTALTPAPPLPLAVAPDPPSAPAPPATCSEPGALPLRSDADLDDADPRRPVRNLFWKSSTALCW